MASPVLAKKGGALVVDERTTRRPSPTNYKSLRFARLPVNCDDCVYRAKMVGGNGICNEYKAGSVCSIRKDIQRIIKRFEGKRDYAQVLPLLEQEFMQNYEKLKFFESVENMTGELNPEVTKRIKVLDGLGKTLSEMRRARTTTEVTQTRTLSDDQKEQIAQTIRLTTEEMNNADTV